MSVENEVANLTTSVDNLTEAVNVKKQTLDATVADSEAARDQSQTARDTALTYRDQSLSHANDALAYSQDAASAVAYQDLASVAESKSESAVDVFVYDTSRDSDGGAWRHRTQHTSWYNEPLNTATRGSRREFPAVAVIVAESNKVTIYDGDDPSLPMWMVFEANTYNVCPNPPSSIQARDGSLAMGGDNATSAYANSGVRVVHFPADRIRQHTAADGHSGLYPAGIASRNGGLFNNVGSEKKIVSNVVKDVAMTVLPDAPIDEATGLPVPTIAVATSNDVSVIKDDGTVIDAKAGRESWAVGFCGEKGYVVQGYSSNNIDAVYLFDIPQTDVSLGNGYSSSYDAAAEFYPAASGAEEGKGIRIDRGSSNKVGFSEIPDGFAWRGNDKLAIVNRSPSDPSSALLAHFTTTYNTGWMNGDIKGAFLSDTDDTDLVGSVELVTNGDFSDGSTGWELTRFSVVNEQAVFGDTWGANSLRSVDVLEAGKTYVFSVTHISDDNPDNLVIFVGGNKQGSFATPPANSTTNLTRIITIDTSGQVEFRFESTSAVGEIIDNISVKLADADRSVNNNGLIINGTVTRSPVATGADLVAYSGFSTSNYLEQPYNPDLDFGTGDFSIMWWAKNPGLDVLDCTDADGTRQDGFWIFSGGANLRVFEGGNQASFQSGVTLPTFWSLCCWTVTNGGATGSLYVNGELKFSGSSVNYPSSSINAATNRALSVGLRQGGTSPFSGSLALLRISATAPTPEQIKRIYEDEKVLFQENAQATLYGNSDAVTALAHDEVTDLLHVGTSDGRSVFQGLRRVDNTADPVNTAISAHNGMIAEE